jgi:hypothetical protein
VSLQSSRLGLILLTVSKTTIRTEGMDLIHSQHHDDDTIIPEALLSNQRQKEKKKRTPCIPSTTTEAANY